MQKKPRLNIPGTKVDSVNYQLLVSTGVPALDDLLGGGLPVGGVLLVDEDLHGSYTKILLKYFLAEGVVNSHSCLVASMDLDPERDLVNNLPQYNKDGNVSSEEEKVTNSNEKMKIAFRYMNLPSEKQKKTTSGNFYDLSQKMPSEMIGNADITYFSDSGCGREVFMEYPCNSFLKQVAQTIKSEKFSLDGKFDQKNILRICVHHLYSPMWSSKKNLKEITQFLYYFKSLVRKSFSVAMISVPTHLSEKLKNIFDSRLIHVSDIALKLETFVGTVHEKNPSLNDFHGFFHITKLAALNSLTSKHPGAVEYVFKLRRKKFCIERLHLPPCLESVEDNKPKKATLGCATSGGGSALDF